MIKNTLIALAVLLVSATAFAKDTTFEACTADHVLAVSIVSLDDDVPAGLEHKLRAIFAKVGSSMTFEEFASAKGYVTYRDALSADEKEAFESILQPVAQGECK